MSPELIAPQRFGLKNSRPTKPSDCYALGMVIYETISGKLPFHKHTDLTIFMKVVEGERPPRGTKFVESLWGMLELCWAPQPNNRPNVEDVLQCLEVVSNSSGPSPGADEGIEDDWDDWDSATGSPGDTMASERRTATSSGPSYFADSPPSRPVSTSSLLSREVTSPDPSTPQTSSGRGGPLPPPQEPGNYQPAQGTQTTPTLDTIWGQNQDGAADGEYSPDSCTGEWPETTDPLTDDFDNFVLYCGAEDLHPSSLTTPLSISPLPTHRRRMPPHRTTPSTNGCGAIVHTAAVPRKRSGVWMAKFGSTDAVIEMDSQYFDHSVVVGITETPCGCVREGIGCRLWCVGPTFSVTA